MWLRKFRRRRILLLAVMCIILISVFFSQFPALRFDPEPRLQPHEAEELLAAYPLPDKHGGPGGKIAAVKRIHFMYRGYTLDEELKPYLASWRNVYPDYKIYFWTDREINELVKRRYPEWTELYHHQLSNYLERSDTARAFILNSMGGWYADLDAGSLRRADDVAAAHALVLPLEPYVHAFDNFNKRRLVSNAIMYSVPRHPFWMYYLERLRASLVGRSPRKSTLEAVFVTGPVMLTETTLLFIQAHSGRACPRSHMCPYLPQPVHFLPTYDQTPYKRDRIWLYCTFTFSYPELAEDCRRFESQDYRNIIDQTKSYTYHSFKHLNEKKDSVVTSESDVRSWALQLTVANAIFSDLE